MRSTSKGMSAAIHLIPSYTIIKGALTTLRALPTLTCEMTWPVSCVVGSRCYRMHRVVKLSITCFSNYHHYKEYLKEVGNQRAESMNMLIFKKPHGYVALVKFNIVTRRNGGHQYTVNATLTCQRFSYFELQESTLDELPEKLQNLKTAE